MNPKNILDILNRDLSEFKDETPVFQSEIDLASKIKGKLFIKFLNTFLMLILPDRRPGNPAQSRTSGNVHRQKIHIPMLITNHFQFKN